MKRTTVVKFPHAAHLFKFCQRVLGDKKGGKIHDQEVGAILEFNPSDCSHWKRGEKNVKSVFALAQIASALEVEAALIHDLASGLMGLDEAYFEYNQTREMWDWKDLSQKYGRDELQKHRTHLENLAQKFLKQADITTSPIYLPEILRLFPFVTTQPADLTDRITRILRPRPGSYTIQYARGDLKSQTRFSMARDLVRILLRAERQQFPELASLACPEDLYNWEEMVFAASLLLPRFLLLQDLGKFDGKKNLVNEISSSFWVPKCLVSFQFQEILIEGEREKALPVRDAATLAR